MCKLWLSIYVHYHLREHTYVNEPKSMGIRRGLSLLGSKDPASITPGDLTPEAKIDTNEPEGDVVDALVEDSVHSVSNARIVVKNAKQDTS